MSPTEVHGTIPEIIRNDRVIYEGDLIPYFRVVFHKALNVRNPYHNFRHLCHVLWLCYKACMFYQETLNPREIRNLLIAALFHDFNHTGKVVPDSVNIKRAIDALKDYILQEDREAFPDIKRIIEATEFPYVVPSEKLDLSCQIIRDSDLSQALSVAWIQQVIFGLSEEWNKPPLEVLKMQRPFHENLKFSTEWAKQEFPQDLIKQKIVEAQELTDILFAESVPI